jgi:GH35 family endo-1,4-beta-xylanase
VRRNLCLILGCVALLPAQTTLREAGVQSGLLMGAAADADESGPNKLSIPAYAATLGSQYNMLEPENAMKWSATHPAQNAYNFEPGDALVAFAQTHQMQTRGHNLCWGTNNPAWLTTLAATATPAAMAGVFQDHINTVVTHYKGQVFAWDVVNEAVSDSQTGTGTVLKNSIWYNQPGIGMTGTGYVEQAFRWAHAADPDALLFYNDYNIEAPGRKFDAVYNMVKDFVARGVPIHGVGIQMHIDTSGYPNSVGLAQNIQQLTGLGLQVHITEADVKLKVDSTGAASAGDLQAQAQTYQRILTVCLQNPGCKAFQTWGFTDKYSWIPSAYPGFGAALPFDASYQPKPAFNSLIGALQTAACSYSISPGGQGFPAAGGTGTINITAPAGCSWAVAGAPGWVTFTSAASGSGSGSVSYKLAANTGGDQIATLTIAGLPFTIEVTSITIAGAVNVGSMAQIASAQGWDTAIELINLGSTAAQARLNFLADPSGGPLQLPFTFPQMPSAQGPLMASTLDQTINPNALFVLDTTGPASQNASVGSAQLQAAGNVVGFGVFTNAASNWEAVVPLETRNAPSYILAFDNTGSIVTGLAIANLSAQAASIKAVVRDASGVQIGGPQTISLTAQGHTSFLLNANYPITAGIRGTIEFDTPAGGQISVLGLRFNGPALTTVPVLANVAPGTGSLSHVTYNGGWQTTLTLVNTAATSTTPTLSFFDDTGNPLAVPLESSSATLTPMLAPGQSLVLQTQGQDSLDSISGSAVLASTGNVSGFAIFHNTGSGQEAVVPLESRSAAAYVLAYDNTGGLVTGLALANATGQAANLTVTVRDDRGSVLQTGPIALAPHGHTSMMLTSGYAMSAGKRGTVEIDGPAGFSALGLFFTPAGNVTTLPVFALK